MKHRRSATLLPVILICALLAYGVFGAMFNDVYFPGRRSGGLHFRYDSAVPAGLAIVFYAMSLFVGAFRASAAKTWTIRGFKLAAILSLATAIYFVFAPSGRAVVSEAQCRQAYARLGRFATDLDGNSPESVQIFTSMAASCDREPMLKTFHDCVMRAAVPTDINGCSDETRRLYHRMNIE